MDGTQLPSRVTVEPDKASPARVYDWFLGGSHNFAVDREVAEQAVALIPEIPEIARANRHFLRRAVLAVVELGVDQFLDLGSGIPTVGNVHEVAREVNPDARVVYVDLDPVAVAQSKQILGDDPKSYVLQADLLDGAGVVGDEGVKGLLDLSRPVCLLMVAVGHFIADDTALGGAIAAYRELLPSGSYIVMSHGTQAKPTAESEKIQQMYARGGTATVSRTADELAALLTGWEPIEPGIVYANDWRPADAEAAGSTMYNVLAVVARKP
jgi:S-adenosyl methyltransferase